jgi:hypothetical protein
MKITTRTATTWLDDDGILRSVNVPGCEQTLEDALANYEATRQVSLGISRPLLVDASHVKSVSREARNVYSRPENVELTVALALLTGSPVSRVIGNFFIGLNRTAMPTRVFNSEPDAIAWLRTFLRRPS